MTRFIDFEIHLKQQLILEQWAVNRGIKGIDIPDFTDYLTHHDFVVDYNEIDLIYKEWK